jgi:MFS family permease
MIAALWAGARADSADRRHLLLTAHSGLTLGHLLLRLHAIMNLRSVPVLLALVACQSLSYGAIVTTQGAVLSRVVPPDLLAAANSLNSLAMYTGAVVGPLLAGLLIPVTGLGTLYLLDAIALLIVLWAVFRLPSLPSRTGPTTIGRDVRRPLVGFRLLATDRVLAAVVVLDLAATVFGMPWALFPELAAQIGSPGDSTVLTLLYAAFPAGILACTLTSGTFTRTHRPGRMMAVATLVWGATVVLAGLAPDLWLTLVALGLGGAVNLLLSTCRKTITQTRVDDTRRGRLQGALTVVSVGGPQAGTLVHGFAGAVCGALAALCLGGVLTAVTAATVIARSSPLWRLHSNLDGSVVGPEMQVPAEVSDPRSPA